MLSSSGLLVADLPFESRAPLDKEFPRIVSVGDATYEAGRGAVRT